MSKIIINRVTCCCPDCNSMHDIDRRIIGAHHWNVCPACLRKIDDDTAAVLKSRGIALQRA